MFELTESPINAAALREQLLGNENCGAFNSFEGWVRRQNEGSRLCRLPRYYRYRQSPSADLERRVLHRQKRGRVAGQSRIARGAVSRSFCRTGDNRPSEKQISDGLLSLRQGVWRSHARGFAFKRQTHPVNHTAGRDLCKIPPKIP